MNLMDRMDREQETDLQPDLEHEPGHLPWHELDRDHDPVQEAASIRKKSRSTWSSNCRQVSSLRPAPKPAPAREPIAESIREHR